MDRDATTPTAPPTVSREAILRGIRQLAHTKVGWDGPVEPEMRLVEDLHLDSLRLLTLAVEVEDRFRVCLDEADEAEIETVGDLVRVVAQKLEEEGPDPAGETNALDDLHD